jgi:hypothetical protein
MGHAQALEALREEQELLKRIVDDGPLAITIVDRSGSIVFANRQAEELFGLERSEIVSRAYNAPDWKITDIDGSPFPDEKLPFRIVMAPGQSVHNIQHAIILPSGVQRVLSISGAPLTDSQGRIERAVFTVEDVTARVRAEDRFSKAFHATGTLMALSTVKDGRFIEVNDAFLTTLGYAREEVVGRTSAELDIFVDLQERERVRRAIMESGGKSLRDLAVRVKAKDGSVRHGIFYSA